MIRFKALPILLLLNWLSLSVHAQQELIQLEKDPFKQPDILKYRPPAPVQPQSLPGLDETEIEVPELNLTATLISVTEPMIMVNDTLLQVGEEIEGMTLILIDEGRAVFRLGGRQYEYTIENKKTK